MVFVHDFVHVDYPLDQVLAHFGPVVTPCLGELVAAAWQVDRDSWVAAGLQPRDLTPPRAIPVVLGQVRVRPDGVVVPLSWPLTSARLVPACEADLEIASSGPRRTDLQLMGRYEFGPKVDRWSRTGSLAHRVTVSAMRSFLQLIAARLEVALAMPRAGFG